MSALPELSIVVPAHNEAARLPASARRLLGWLGAEGVAGELVLVDDGSTDATAAAMAALAAEDARVVAMRLPANRGKGAAVAAGMARARGRRRLFCDADLAYGTDPIGPALRALEAGAEVVLGARDLEPRDSRARYGLLRRLASSTFNRMVGRALDLGVRDTQCGFKAFSAAAAEALFPALTIAGFGFDVELIYLARLWGLEVTLLPVEMQRQDDSRVHVARHGLEMAADLAAVAWRARRGKYPARRPTAL